MKVFEVCLKPTSDYATELQGDCLFGQVCWQLAQDETLAGKINEILNDYDTNPFCVVSDPCISFMRNEKREYLLKRPFYPLPPRKLESLDYEQEKKLFSDRKSRKGCKWVIVAKSSVLNPLDENMPVNLAMVRSRFGLAEDWQPYIASRQSHNSIDRLTGTTGTGGEFAPYASNLISWHPAIELTVFIGIRNDVRPEAVFEAIRRIGITGYGADASTGKGRFEISGKPAEINLAELGSEKPDSLYTLSAVVPESDTYASICFEPFVRFGRHGHVLARSDSPFKQPVLKASTGAIFTPAKDRWPTKPFIGRAVKELSRHNETVEQGYSLFIPVKTEAPDDC